MSSALISVIVPVYKVEKYLDRCIDSLVQQTYHDLEIILIDDGSPDQCPEICDSWSRKDGRIRVIHKENGGVSSARNLGLETANGTHVMFVDSDDFLPKNAIEILAACNQKCHSDLVCGSYCMLKTRQRFQNISYKECLITRKEFSEQLSLFTSKLHSACWAKLYDLQTIRKNQLTFPVNMPSGEDTVFYYHYLVHCSSIYIVNQCTYFYDITPVESAVKKYYKEINQFVKFQFNAQQKFVTSLGDIPAEFTKELALDHFVYCIGHYILREENQDQLIKKIQETASLFPEAKNHPLYGRNIQQQQWMQIIRKWKQKNFVLYLKDAIKHLLF